MRLIHKGATTPHPTKKQQPHQWQNKRIKSPEITSSHTGKTAAQPAYNRAHQRTIRHAAHRPKKPPHLE